MLLPVYVNKIKILKELTLFSTSTGASGKNFRSTDVFTRAAVSSAPLAIPSSLQKTEQNITKFKSTYITNYQVKNAVQQTN